MTSIKKEGSLWHEFLLVMMFLIVLTPLAFGFTHVVLTPIVNKVTDQPYSCVVESVELYDPPGRGYQSVSVYTKNCGEIYMKRLEGMDVDSYEDLAQKLEERKGQALVFHIGRMQMFSHYLRAERVEF